MGRRSVPNLSRAVLGGLVGVVVGALPTWGQVPPDAAALVNGTPIPRKALEEIVLGIAAVRGEAEREARRKEWEQSALESLVDFELLYQEAKRVGVAVDGEDVEKELQRTQKKFGEQSAWQRALAERGWTLDDVRNDTERALVVQRFLETIVWREVQVDPREVEEFYDKNRDQFHHPDQLRLRHTVVPVLGGTKRAWSEAERKATAIRRGWLARGVDREGLSSTGDSDSGMDLGWVARGDLDPPVENIVFALAPGQVSEPLRREDGIHLFFVTARRPAGVIPLDEARPKIEAVLRKRERQRLRDALLSRLRQQAEIVFP